MTHSESLAQPGTEFENPIHYKWKLKANLKKLDLDTCSFEWPELMFRIHALREIWLDPVDGYLEFDWDPHKVTRRRFAFQGYGAGCRKGNPSEHILFVLGSRSIRFTKWRKTLRFKLFEMQI